MAYPVVKAQLDGVAYKAIGVGDETYLIWTLARDAKANLTKVIYNDVEIDNKKPTQTVQDGDTYIHWSEIPNLTPHYLDGGVINFTTQEQNIPHNYTMVITEPETETVGLWAQLLIYTFDNGKSLPNQPIEIRENGQLIVTDKTDAQNGGYLWAITETTDKVDTMEFSWTDPNGKVHTVTNTTHFVVPAPTDTPVPSDDSKVVVFPILPSSDASNAVYFDITAQNGQSVEVQLDTGAFELMFTTSAAITLGLVKEQSLTVQGVGGQNTAYYSHATFSINGVEFKDVPCVIDDNFQGYPLFGYKFFVDNGYDLLVSHKHHTVTVLK